ncbi:hypothetical protein ACFL1B_01500 [Nanoarchaeota archaeon]
MKVTMLFLVLLLIYGCSPKDCREYDYTECPLRCSLCGDSVWDSSVECNTKSYCEEVGLGCNSLNLTECDGSCSVCPPCEECSALVCQPQKVCEKLGFEEVWYENMQVN